VQHQFLAGEMNMELQTGRDTHVQWLDSALSRLEILRTPFPHATGDDILDEAAALESLCWLEQCNLWQLKKGDRHSYESTGHIERLISGGMGWIVGSEALGVIGEHLGRIFQRKMKPGTFQLEAHRMSAGQWIGPHNDAPIEGRRTHRFVITLSRSEVCGGELVLIGDKQAENVPAQICSRHNSAIALEFSQKSFHRVDEVKKGTRYSLVFSFWAQET
jgi:hypothetical protein